MTSPLVLLLVGASYASLPKAPEPPFNPTLSVVPHSLEEKVTLGDKAEAIGKYLVKEHGTHRDNVFCDRYDVTYNDVPDKVIACYSSDDRTLIVRLESLPFSVVDIGLAGKPTHIIDVDSTERYDFSALSLDFQPHVVSIYTNVVDQLYQFSKSK